MQNVIKIPTRVGWELFFPINFLFLFLINNIVEKNNWQGLYILLPILLLINYMFFSIQYKIENNTLFIHSGFGSVQEISIAEITKIEKTWNPLASAAPSIMGRVEIYYKKQSVIISPKNFDLFQHELLKINPNIIVKK